MSLKLPVYLDYQSTTPMDPRVIDIVSEEMRENFGNPHSRNHIFGWKAEETCEIARERIAGVIGADSKDIVFTSGATESNNLALQGVASFYGEKKKHIITTVIEHKCIINACKFLEGRGFRVTYLPVQKDGILDLELLKSAITNETLLVSIMAVNNEIGVIQNLKEIGKITREKGVFFHTDAAQGFGKIPLDVDEMNIDLMSISAHKIYGPKGIGALYVRRKPRVRLLSLFQGGGQERGFRSGTLPTPFVAGFGLAAEISNIEMESENKKLLGFFDKFYKELIENGEQIFLNGSREHRIPGNFNASFAFIEGESMIMAIKDLAVSSGSACTSASLEPSYVIRALGVTEDLAHTSIRIGFGRFTTEEEVDFAIKTIKENIDGLREISPLWEMHQEGIDISKIAWDEGH
jgi:cysteine desulfurase